MAGSAIIQAPRWLPTMRQAGPNRAQFAAPIVAKPGSRAIKLTKLEGKPFYIGL